MPALPTPSAVHLQVLLDQASLVGPGGSEGTASLQVNVSRSAGTGGTYEEHHCDLDDGDAAAGKSEGEEIGGSPMAGVKQNLREGLAWEEWQRQPPVQRLAADGTQLSVIRAELPLLPPPPSGGVRLTALEILSAVLLQWLGLTASLQGAPHHHLVTRLNCLGTAAVVAATHHWVQLARWLRAVSTAPSCGLLAAHR
ncbi:hypothetical protein Vretimale_20015 [Volvox reticuliferus]|uniref:Uncharacterized protein n=1 Tax=Volvox reticuliferus TaxID=1737510 RepID=A0A8J4H050_9CHLO|nr:hypothetical protein Vretimale_20015 [Volvox reticuliferus]